MQEYVRTLRERWFGLGTDAISAVEHALTEQKDGRLGFQVLASIGVIPSPEERRSVVIPLVETDIGQIEAAQFVSHSGIRFPQNGCLSCPHLGLCLNNQPLIDANLVRKAGASDLDWLDELVD